MIQFIYMKQKYFHRKWIVAPTLLFATLSQAQNKNIVLHGQIFDQQNNQPIPGAVVKIENTNYQAISNDSGYYKITLPNRAFVLNVNSLSYQSKIQEYNPAKDTILNIFLSPSQIEEKDIVVVSTAAGISTRKSPQPVSIIHKRELLASSSTNAIQAIANLVPGVSVLSTGPAIGKPFIRGLGYNRVLTVIDGVRQEGQQWGDEHGIEVDDYSISDIQVLKGPASLMYGSDALAGVILFRSQVPAPEGTLHANVTSEYQTNNRLRGYYANVGGTKNGFSFNAYGSYKGAKDYKNKYDGRVFNSRFYNANFGGMLGIAKNWGYSRLLVTNFNQHIGMTEGERDSLTGQFLKDTPDGNVIVSPSDFSKLKPEIPYQHINHFKVTSDNKFYIGDNSLNVILGWQRNQRREFGNASAPNTPDAYFDLKTFTYDTKYLIHHSDYWHTSLGINGMAQNNTNRALERLIPNYNLFDIGGYGFTQYSKNKWTVMGGLRWDTRHVNGKKMMDPDDPTAIKFTQFSRNFSNISGSLGMSYAATQSTTLKFNIARGYRAPNLAELSSNGAHEGTNRFEIGNRNLKYEQSLQIDGGVDVRTEHIAFTASLFYNHISNFIFYERITNANGQDSTLDNPDDPSEKLQVYRFDQHNAFLYGGEMSLDIHPHPLDWLHILNNFSYTRAQFTQAIGGSKNIPDIPAAHWVAQLRSNFFDNGKSYKNLSFMIESDYTFRQNRAFTGFNTETQTPGYWLVNAAIGMDFAHNGKTMFSLFLTGNNLGDIAYQSHLSRLKYLDMNYKTGRQGIFNMGRNFGIKLNVPLQWKW